MSKTWWISIALEGHIDNVERTLAALHLSRNSRGGEEFFVQTEKNVIDLINRGAEIR